MASMMLLTTALAADLNVLSLTPSTSTASTTTLATEEPTELSGREAITLTLCAERAAVSAFFF